MPLQAVTLASKCKCHVWKYADLPYTYYSFVIRGRGENGMGPHFLRSLFIIFRQWIIHHTFPRVVGIDWCIYIFPWPKSLLNRTCVDVSKIHLHKYTRNIFLWIFITNLKRIGKVFYGQEPPSGEPTTTDSGVDYQLLAVMYWSSPMGNS